MQTYNHTKNSKCSFWRLTISVEALKARRRSLQNTDSKSYLVSWLVPWACYSDDRKCQNRVLIRSTSASIQSCYLAPSLTTSCSTADYEAHNSEELHWPHPSPKQHPIYVDCLVAGLGWMSGYMLLAGDVEHGGSCALPRALSAALLPLSISKSPRSC